MIVVAVEVVEVAVEVEVAVVPVPVVPVSVFPVSVSVDFVAGVVCSVFVDDVVGVEVEQPCIGGGDCAGRVP